MRLLLEDDSGGTWLLEEAIAGDRAALLLNRAKAISEGVEEAYRRSEAGDQTARALLANAPCHKVAEAMGCRAGVAAVVPFPTR